jgi:DNA-binding response OmpR family regulator
MKHVLTIDDQPAIVRLVQINLERAGYRVSVAFDGQEGMERVRELRPDLVILDVTMPKKDGFEVLTEIRRDPSLAATKVLMLTVRAHSQDVVSGLGMGADLYLTKPFTPQELVSIVERLLPSDDAGRDAGAGAAV